MKQQKKPTTCRLVITYTDGTHYTIPRVSDLKVGDNEISGTNKSKVVNCGLTQHITVDFILKFDDVKEIKYLTTDAYPDTTFKIVSGKITDVSHSYSRGGVFGGDRGYKLDTFKSNTNDLFNSLYTRRLMINPLDLGLHRHTAPTS